MEYDFLGHPVEKNSQSVLKTYLISFDKKLDEAYAHAKQYDDLNQAMWPYQDFSLSIDELLRSAKKNSFIFPDVAQKLKDAYEHVLIYNQQGETLWSHYDFALNIVELLEHALNNVDVKFCAEKKKEVEQRKKSYQETIQQFEYTHEKKNRLGN